MRVLSELAAYRGRTENVSLPWAVARELSVSTISHLFLSIELEYQQKSQQYILYKISSSPRP